MRFYHVVPYFTQISCIQQKLGGQQKNKSKCWEQSSEVIGSCMIYYGIVTAFARNKFSPNLYHKLPVVSHQYRFGWKSHVFWITSPFCSNVSWLQTQILPWCNMVSWLPPLPDFLSCQILKILIPVGSTRSSNPIAVINFRYIITPPKVLQSLQVTLW